MILELPYPPSINHYWLASGHRRYISKAGKAFRREVYCLVKAARAVRLVGDVAVHVELYPPDRRRRDIDNVIKPLLDALQYAEVFKDDCQVAELTVIRSGLVKNGRSVVTVHSVK
jgi:crossover junction endodeoxyribonuclease RusA